MNRTFLIVMILAVLLGCKDRYSKPQEKSNAVDLTNTKASTVKVEAIKQEEEIIPMSTNCNETFNDFENFFKRFSTDSIFQKRRTKYPLKHIYYKDMLDNEATIEFIADRKSYYYKYKDFIKDKDGINNEYGKYEVRIEKSDSTYLYRRMGIDNDIRVIFSFEILNDCWLLFSIEN